jgi:hypothetical protein
MKKINKFILGLLFVLSVTQLYPNSNTIECPIVALANDISTAGTEFKTLVKDPEIFKAWDLLNKETPTLRTNIEELKLVSKNLGNISNAGGYLKWKATIKVSESLVPPSLLAKITEKGAQKLKAWTKTRNITYKPRVGESISGASVEAKIFNDLDSFIENKKVLETLEDEQGRSLFVLERPGQTHQVLTLHPTNSAEFKMTMFQPAYNPNLNPNISVLPSTNKLVPDYKGTRFMHPDNIAYLAKIMEKAY